MTVKGDGGRKGGREGEWLRARGMGVDGTGMGKGGKEGWAGGKDRRGDVAGPGDRMGEGRKKGKGGKIWKKRVGMRRGAPEGGEEEIEGMKGLRREAWRRKERGRGRGNVVNV